VIALSDGKRATGATSKVDDKFWHALTYKRTWCIDGDGYARSGKVKLHKAILRGRDTHHTTADRGSDS
jgi:hypothetical protein